MGHGYKQGTASEWYNTLPLGGMQHKDSTNSHNVLSPRKVMGVETVTASLGT